VLVTFPTELAFFEHQWHCRHLFRLFDPKALLELLTAVLLEESIVIVDSDPTLISSVVLGLMLLLRPFKWPYIMIPVLPSTLIDILDAP